MSIQFLTTSLTSELLSVSEYEDDGYEFPLNDYSGSEDYEKSSSIYPIPNLNTD